MDQKDDMVSAFVHEQEETQTGLDTLTGSTWMSKETKQGPKFWTQHQRGNEIALSSYSFLSFNLLSCTQCTVEGQINLFSS